MTAAHKPLPHIGARIVKSSVGAALCILIYYLRELLPVGSGIPFYSVLSVLWCIQPYTTSTKTMAKQRTIGTAIGAVYGLAFLLFFGLFDSISTMVVYLAASAMIIPILYTTVLIHKQNWAT